MTSTYSTGVLTAQPVAGRPEDAGPGRWRGPLRGPLRVALCLLPALVVAAAGFQRRWMSDDGHIYVRTVRQVLAGNGPVFNPGERAESSTGTLWQWLLVVAGAPGFDITALAVYGGLLLTAVGFALAGLGALRLYGGNRLPLPCGALVLLALPPVRDFATSGLETGLATCWLAGAWLALVARPRSLATCALLGLGPLVRPDLALVSAVFLAGQWVIARPPWRGVLAGAGVAAALPVAYEIFRMGYYGHLVPLPGVTKEASRSLWARGADYLQDFAGPYLLWLPLLIIVAAALAHRPLCGRGLAVNFSPTSVNLTAIGVTLTPMSARRLAPVAAPLLAGALCWLYVIKVGGDFMHGRMFLPGPLLLLLPVFVVPVTRAWTIAVTGISLWAVFCAAMLRVPYEGRIGPQGIADERGVYVRQNAAAHPLHHDFAGQPGNMAYARLVRGSEERRKRTLLLAHTPLPAARPGVTGVYNTLGFSGTVIPLSGAALDPIGLAYPLAAHSESFNGRVGHDKRLPDEWIVAERGVPGALPKGMDSARVDAARRALRCGPFAELRAATRAPMTVGRFLRNLAGAVERTSFRFSNDPVRAEREACGRRG
ncbi:Terminal beta-(1-_2)-arabinofuranosyltransferase [Streptomyces alboniger]